jgi:ATP-binding cassette subfamily B protein
MGFFDTKMTGDILQRITDHERVQTFLTGQTLNIAFSFLSFIVFGIVLYVYSPIIFGIFLLGSAVYAIWITIFLNRRRILDYELFEQMSVNQSKTYQMITCMQAIKLHNCEKRRRWEWEDTQADLFEVKLKSLKLQQTQESGNILINEVKNILITVFAATSVIQGDLTLGTMLAIQFIVGQLNSPIEQFMSFLYALQDVKISLERINEVHDRNEEGDGNTDAGEMGISDSITFKSVDFKYNRHNIQKTLDNLSIEIPKGKVTAIVGASGSGKTTLIKLLLGYYPVDNGSITVGNRNINTFNPVLWRKRCGVVMQDGVIFSESIARNIAVDDNDIDVVKMENAAKIANMHDFIMSLPLNYNTKIGHDGCGLSQGQKQRILIARAVYLNPDYIFLDEATNSLDAENERIIVENLSDFYKGKTVVIVAHRLSTVKDADNIIVMEKGEIAEQGSHQYLVGLRGIYYNLIKNQLELGL